MNARGGVLLSAAVAPPPVSAGTPRRALPAALVAFAGPHVDP
jgi:hypothetical protein